MFFHRISRLFVAALLALTFASSTVTAQTAHRKQRDSWIGADKIKHFFMSAFIESLTFSGLQAVGASRGSAFAGAIGVTSAFGVGKELYDRRTKGLFSIRDLTWDAAGAGAAGLMLRSTQH